MAQLEHNSRDIAVQAQQWLSRDGAVERIALPGVALYGYMVKSGLADVSIKHGTHLHVCVIDRE